MKHFICLDVELGGLPTETSLLTLYIGFFVLNDGKFTLLQELDLKIKPNDGIYKLTSQGMEVNKINFIEHDKVAITEKQAGTELYRKLQLWNSIANDKLIPVGQNILGDIKRITDHLISVASWENFVSIKVLDTCIIGQFLKICDKLPEDVSLSLENLGLFFDINIDGNLHEAKYDVLLNIKILEELMKIVNITDSIELRTH